MIVQSWLVVQQDMLKDLKNILRAIKNPSKCLSIGPRALLWSQLRAVNITKEIRAKKRVSL